MVKKDKKTETKKTNEKEEQEKYPLIELFYSSPIEESWKIYNISRKGLLPQLEYEMKEYGIKEIKPTITIDEFEKIINGKQ